MVRYSISRKIKAVATGGTGGTGCQLGIGAPAAGKTRYVTFLAIKNKYGGPQQIVFCSKKTDFAWSRRTTAASNASRMAKASTNGFFRTELAAKEFFCLPAGGPPATRDAPLFSIAASGYLNVIVQKGSAFVFVHYYDE